MKIEIGPKENVPSWIDSPYEIKTDMRINSLENYGLFFTPLDPHLIYNITLSPMYDDGGFRHEIVLHNITFYSGLL
jgi:hypothetical protein